jgi:formylglycine-generating enzyme
VAQIRKFLWFVPVAALTLGGVALAKGPKKKPQGQTQQAPRPAQTAQRPAAPKPKPATRPAANPVQPAHQQTPAGAKPSKKKRTSPTKRPGAQTIAMRPRINAAIPAPANGAHLVAFSEGEIPAPVDGATCPADMANIENRYCVDRYEGSLVEILQDGTERAWSAYDVIPEGHKLKALSVAGVAPQGYISGAQAQAACQNAGKRLCKPIEWRKACTGPKAQLWGYGNTRENNKCNDRGRSPMLHFYPQVNVSWTLVGMTEMNDPQLNQLDGTLAKTGANASCTNEYGVFDMVGNLHEWTSDPNGTFQGGYYLDTHINGDGCGYRTTAHEFTYHDYSTGFRCCADAKGQASQ